MDSMKDDMIEKGLPGEESVKRFERSNGLDTALYKNYLLPLFFYFGRRDARPGFPKASSTQHRPHLTIIELTMWLAGNRLLQRVMSPSLKSLVVFASAFS